MNGAGNSLIVIFEAADAVVDVRLDTNHDTVWLSQRQMADVFDTSADNISLHLKNIFGDGELAEAATTEESSVVRQEGKRQVTRRIKHYNLDATISVGYRVNSYRAVQFRQWAIRILREHLTQGWTLSRQRLEANAQELEAAMTLLRKTAQSQELDLESGRGLIDIATRYAQTFVLLQRYDEGLLADGNKRSAAFLFVDFLYRNNRLFNSDGDQVINDIGLATLTLLVAESDPASKDTMIRLIMNMLAPADTFPTASANPAPTSCHS